MTGTIRYLKIANFRSIDVLELRDIKPFSVFAGPNGAGKTNFFEALDFVNLVIQSGADEAIKKHGGFKNIHCLRRNLEAARVFEFKSIFEFETETLTYHFKIGQLDSSPTLEEYILEGSTGKKWTVNDFFRDNEEGNQAKEEFLRRGKSFLPIFPLGFSRIHFFNHFRLYKIDQVEAKSPIKNYDDSELSYNGRNLAAVLNRLEKDDEIRETILEWMELIVPGLEKVQTQSERLTGSTVLTFQEEGVEEAFPAHLISDGTIYLLSILVAILDRPFLGMTLIEEPERGLHPQAIMELVDGFREYATFERPIWVTTHNEALVRCLKNYELWLVDKKQGRTEMKQVQVADKLVSSLDQAWLTNALGGGLPW
ncbi:MAG: AAA family ATPase [Pseudomonadota bacterium]